MKAASAIYCPETLEFRAIFLPFAMEPSIMELLADQILGSASDLDIIAYSDFQNLTHQVIRRSGKPKYNNVLVTVDCTLNKIPREQNLADPIAKWACSSGFTGVGRAKIEDGNLVILEQFNRPLIDLSPLRE